MTFCIKENVPEFRPEVFYMKCRMLFYFTKLHKFAKMFNEYRKLLFAMGLYDFLLDENSLDF